MRHSSDLLVTVTPNHAFSREEIEQLENYLHRILKNVEEVL